MTSKLAILRILTRRRKREDDGWYSPAQIASGNIPKVEAKDACRELADEGVIERFNTTHNGPYYRAKEPANAQA